MIEDYDKAEAMFGTEACEALGDLAAFDLALPSVMFALALETEAPETRDRIVARLRELLAQGRA